MALRRAELCLILALHLFNLFGASAASVRLRGQEIQSCRADSAYPGATIYFWFPKGGENFISPKLPTGWTLFEPANIGGSIPTWYRQWAWGVRVPKSASPGPYEITAGTAAIAVTVVPAPRFPRLVKVPPGESISAALQRSTNLELLPGIHPVRSPLECRDGTIIRSAGAVLERHRDVNPSVYMHQMFAPRGALHLDGLILTHDSDLQSGEVTYLHKWPREGREHVTVRNCIIRGGLLGKSTEANMVVESCRFERGMSGQVASGSVWIQNDFVGQTRRGEHQFFNTGASSLLMCSNRWHHTNRGIVFQTGDCRNSVVIESYFYAIHGGENNASECILLEGGTGNPPVPAEGERGMRHNTFIDSWLIDCAGPGVSLFGSGMHHNQFLNTRANVETQGISLTCTGSPAASMDANEFHNTLTTGTVRLQGDVGKLLFGNLQVVESVQRAGNAMPQREIMLAENQGFPFLVDAVALQKARVTLNSCSYNSLHGQQQITSLTFRPSTASAKR
jgi:hypothetical protein